MAKNFGQIKEMARHRAKMLNSDFISPEEEAFIINDCCRDLYHDLVTDYEKFYVKVPPLEFSLAQGDTYGTIPGDMYKCAGIDFKVSGKWGSLRPFNFVERNRGNAIQATATLTQRYAGRYQIVGRKIMVSPALVGDFRLWYVPDFEDMTVDAQELDPEMSRFWKIITLNAAIQYLNDEESDISGLRDELGRSESKLAAYIDNRIIDSESVGREDEYHDEDMRQWL